jgi:hypothetical protein
LSIYNNCQCQAEAGAGEQQQQQQLLQQLFHRLLGESNREKKNSLLGTGNYVKLFCLEKIKWRRRRIQSERNAEADFCFKSTKLFGKKE